jgi:hypothetical protein
VLRSTWRMLSDEASLLFVGDAPTFEKKHALDPAR